ncbi:MAG TPA: TolC family protein [Gemmatimonadaceae bacterium]|nr:TolC family protein [Gemmatimonadaceae bacterium]
MTGPLLALVLLAATAAAPAAAQTPAQDTPMMQQASRPHAPDEARHARSAVPDTLHLGALQQAAVQVDPRRRQLALQHTQSELRLRDLRAERLPSLALEGQGQYQSDVIAIPIRLPNGQEFPALHHDTYDAHLSVQERLLDPVIGPRRAAEHAQLAEAQARVRTALYGVRQDVNDAFFTAALMQARAAELATIITDLDAQHRVIAARVREGAALPGEAAVIEAELMQRQQDQTELRANRAAALDVLGDLTGRPIGDEDRLALPDLDSAVAALRRAQADTLRRRPEYQQFTSTRELLARQQDVTSAETRPRISAFGRFGYGRPGLDLLSNRFDAYWLAGIQVQWSPWNWGTTGRERQALVVQQRIVATEQQAFTHTMHRAVVQDLATIDRLHSALVADDRIIALREQVERETRARFDEGVVTAAEYVARRTDVLDARLARDTHRVQLAQASARYLTTLGVEVR